MSRANRAWMEINRAFSRASTGRRVGTGEYPGGAQSSTTIRVAPLSMARRSGTLFTTAPSMKRSPSISTGGNKVGMAEDARIASTAGPKVNHRSRPSLSEVATTSTGITASSSRSIPIPFSTTLRRPSLE